MMSPVLFALVRLTSYYPLILPFRLFLPRPSESFVFANFSALHYLRVDCISNLAQSALGAALSTRCRQRTPRRGRFPDNDTKVFRRFLANLLTSTGVMDSQAAKTAVTAKSEDTTDTKPGLKKIPPYWYPYTTMAKGRWLGREILEVVSTEFRDRSMEFYVCYYLLPQRCGMSTLSLTNGEDSDTPCSLGLPLSTAKWPNQTLSYAMAIELSTCVAILCSQSIP